MRSAFVMQFGSILPASPAKILLFATALVIGSSVSAQESPAEAPASDSATQLDVIEVTGSRLKRTDIEGPLPVTVLSRGDIDISGDITIADFLRSQTFNSFGSFDAASGFGAAQGGALISLRGLGSERTLVLLDGRRLPGGPAFNGAAQNLNVLPMAAVERIEVLREGASAIYGSDAIGGVINIITRKDYSGTQISGQVDRPSQAGGNGANSSFITGFVTPTSNFIMTLDHSQRDIIFSRDRSYTSAIIGSAAGAQQSFENGLASPFGFPTSFYAYRTDGTGVGEFDGTPVQFRNGGTFGATGNFDTGADFELSSVSAACPAGGFNTDPNAPNSAIVIDGGENFCAFNFTGVSAETAAVKRDSLTLSGNFDLVGDIRGFGRFTSTRAESFGRFAPSPVTSPLLTINGDNPNNPTLGTAACDTNADADNNPATNPTGCDLQLLYRLVPIGNRDGTTKDDVRTTLLGINSTNEFLGGSDWELALYENRYTQADIGVNYGLRPPIQSLIDSGDFDPFNPDAAGAAEARTTILSDNLTVARGVDGHMRFNGIGLGAALSLPLVVGAEYREDSYKTISDAQSDALNVFGTAGGSAEGGRTYNAFFGETSLTFLDNLLEVGVAARFDSYSDFGNKLSPKLSVGVRPLDNLLLRSSYGQGFRAPDLDVLFKRPAQSFPRSIDRLRCLFTAAATDCTAQQREVSLTGNPLLDAEESDHFSVGLAWEVIDDLSMSLDYYKIELTEGIANIAVQTVLDNELACFQEGRSCNVAREGFVERDVAANAGPDGIIRQPGPDGLLGTADDVGTADNTVPSNIRLGFGLIIQPAINQSTIETDGIDFDVRYMLPTAVGKLDFDLAMSYVLNYETQNTPTSQVLQNVDSEFIPEYRLVAGTTWTVGAVNAGLTLNYVPSTKDCSPSQLTNNSAVCSTTPEIGSYTTLDLQAGWNTPWKGTLVAGVRNLADKDPPLDSDNGYDGTLHDIFGRVPYMRYTQNF